MKIQPKFEKRLFQLLKRNGFTARSVEPSGDNKTYYEVLRDADGAGFYPSTIDELRWFVIGVDEGKGNGP